MPEDYAYMSSSDIKRAAASLLPLIDAVLELHPEPRSTTIHVYMPRPLPRRLLSTAVRGVGRRSKKLSAFAERPIIELSGIDFTDPDSPIIAGMIVVVDDHLRIATPYQPALRRQSDLYILHTLEDYVEVCLAGTMVGTAYTAQVNLTNARYAIERLLPDGHPMKGPERKTDDACIDGRASFV